MMALVKYAAGSRRRLLGALLAALALAPAARAADDPPFTAAERVIIGALAQIDANLER